MIGDSNSNASPLPDMKGTIHPRSKEAPSTNISNSVPMQVTTIPRGMTVSIATNDAATDSCSLNKQTFLYKLHQQSKHAHG